MSVHSILHERYGQENGAVLLSGNQALVRLALAQRRQDAAAGLNTAGFISGYRGSPLAGLDREFGRAAAWLKNDHIVFKPGVNEDLAATAVWGSQQSSFFPGSRYDGVFAMWYGKGPGVDRSMDVLRHANAAGTNPKGGVLLLVGDDHGASSSTLPHQSEHNLISAMIPLLSPAGVQEFIDFGLYGFALSRFSGAWIGFKCQTDIVECTTSVEVDDAPRSFVQPQLAGPASLRAARWPDGSHAMERRLMQDKMAAVAAFASANRIDRLITKPATARFGIAASGKAWLDVLGALDRLGLDMAAAAALGIRLYKIGLVWPLEQGGALEFARGLKDILVVEEKRPVIEDQLRSFLYDLPDGERPYIAGKTGRDGAPLLAAWGEINSVQVARAIAAAFPSLASVCADRLAAMQAAVAPKTNQILQHGREPYFCSGCPHSISTHVPQGSRASTGIGCHMMVIGNADRATSTFTQMGGEGVSWIGLAPFTDEKHIFVNMGDGTYFHSGILALRAAIAAGVNATYKILYNDAVAMTGGQQLDGTLTVLQLVQQVLAEGAMKVAVVAEEPERHLGQLPSGVILAPRDELDEVQRTLREVEGVSVLIFDQVCAAEKRRRRKRGAFARPVARAVINDRVCEGCGDCSVVSNCISVEPLETEFGAKRRINQSSCNVDLSCIKGFCPSFVTIEGATLKKATRPDVRVAAPALPAPAPLLASSIDALSRYDLVLAGIGGTGVITVSAILAQAAQIDGWRVSVFDQTGLAQKNGAVTSFLRLRRTGAEAAPSKIGAAEADVVLGFDLLVTAGDSVLATVDPARSHLVLNSHVAPTAHFVRSLEAEPTADALLSALALPDAARLSAFDATGLAADSIGDAVATNMILLGFGWQKGLVPLSEAAIMAAIELNGTDIGMNRAAFALGRSVAAGLAPVAPATEAPGLIDLEAAVRRRADELVAYQDEALARTYRDLVARVRAVELRVAPGREDLTRTVLQGAWRVMCVKDEYEVARLHLDNAARERMLTGLSGGGRRFYHLAPPFLSRRIDPRTGGPMKIKVGAWIEWGFRALVRMKGLRGTRFDPFALSDERKAERRLREDYLARVNEVVGNLTEANYPAAVEMLGAVDAVRGYGHVKLKALAIYERKVAVLATRFRQS